MKQVSLETVDGANPVGCPWVTLAEKSFMNPTCPLLTKIRHR
jgi:hypothetical protein